MVPGAPDARRWGILHGRRLGFRPPGKCRDARRGERRQDMSEPSEVRPEVVEAILGVLRGGDAAALPPGDKPAEKAAAKDAYLSEFAAERGKRDRQSQAWELLLNRSYDESSSWKQIFDDLEPSAH